MIPEVARQARSALKLCKRFESVLRLRKYGDWSRFDWKVMAEMANDVDEPFVKVMTSLSRRGYEYSAVSMHKWWRRMKAVNQQNLMTFFSFVGFQEPSSKRLFWSDVYQQCCKTSETFTRMSEVYRDDRFVEMNLRSLLGISQATDIRQAWVKWAKQNHPDRGGSVERFVLVKAAYEEWNR